ncbi:hypothetical protein U0070_018711 [Myodes glareolus]|uniref:Succinate dehydrogenase assembly factor 3 n=1 Tax=Myodes glareolus TaxID=447135 RepID=A0AAW0IV41_MYOGA
MGQQSSIFFRFPKTLLSSGLYCFRHCLVAVSTLSLVSGLILPHPHLQGQFSCGPQVLMGAHLSPTYADTWLISNGDSFPMLSSGADSPTPPPVGSALLCCPGCASQLVLKPGTPRDPDNYAGGTLRRKRPATGTLSFERKDWVETFPLEAYAAVLRQQTKDSRQSSTGIACFGTSLPEEKLNDFRDEQIGQLQELMQEATKPNRQFSITESTEPKLFSILVEIFASFAASFVQADKYDSNCILLHADIQFDQHYLLRMLSFPVCISSFFIKNQVPIAKEINQYKKSTNTFYLKASENLCCRGDGEDVGKPEKPGVQRSHVKPYQLPGKRLQNKSLHLVTTVTHARNQILGIQGLMHSPHPRYPILGSNSSLQHWNETEPDPPGGLMRHLGPGHMRHTLYLNNLVSRKFTGNSASSQQEILQTLVSQPAFLFSVDPFSHTPLYNILISQLQLPCQSPTRILKRNVSFAESQPYRTKRMQVWLEAWTIGGCGRTRLANLSKNALEPEMRDYDSRVTTSAHRKAEREQQENREERGQTVGKQAMEAEAETVRPGEQCRQQVYVRLNNRSLDDKVKSKGSFVTPGDINALGVPAKDGDFHNSILCKHLEASVAAARDQLNLESIFYRGAEICQPKHHVLLPQSYRTATFSIVVFLFLYDCREEDMVSISSTHDSAAFPSPAVTSLCNAVFGAPAQLLEEFLHWRLPIPSFKYSQESLGVLV